MILNFIKTGWRNLAKNPAQMLLSNLGLGVTVACGLLVFLLVKYQNSFDNFHPALGRIGRIVTTLHFDTEQHSSGVPYPLAAALRKESTHVEKAAMLDSYRSVEITVAADESKVPVVFMEEKGVAYAEPVFFEILQYSLLRGNISDFSAPNTALLTSTAAERYFGGTAAIGQTFQAFDRSFQVVGILADMPENTDYGKQIFCSWASLENGPEQKEIASWGSLRGGTQCFVRMQPGHQVEELAEQLPSFSKKYPHPVQKDLFEYKAFPLTSLHFDDRFGGSFDQRYLWMLSLIGVFLLITAVINYVNMATARSLGRVREVGVRKTLGSSKWQLFGQFMLETSLLTFTSMLIGLTLTNLSIPWMNDWFGQHLRFSQLLQPVSLAFGAGLFLLLVVLAGAYPGLLLTQFKPVDSLVGKLPLQQASGGFLLRKGLVTTQFFISQLLLVGMLVVVLQMRYAQHSDWGFQRDTILTLPLPEATKAHVLRQQLEQLPEVEQVSFCSSPPASQSYNKTLFRFDQNPETESWPIRFFWTDDNYLATFDLPLVAGRNFTADDSRQQGMVNETFVKTVGLASAEEAIGKQIHIEKNDILITGVLKDFHTESFKETIPPLLLQFEPKNSSLCAVKLSSQGMPQALASVETAWKALFPQGLYEYHILDEDIAQFYDNERQMQRLAGIFTGIAILVGLMGLVGLTAFMILRKTKEIGIRKIIGASIPEILWLFGREYASLMLVGFVLAIPIAIWGMQRWLQNFAYHIPLRWWMFGLTLLVTALLALLTVGVQVVRAALANPVKALRSE
ncbi:MAG: FtsX-like permease family protein [Bacteroidetes bacterium]|nr:FtsX-like permease family protein [Bacteroidota bacterium]